MTRVDVILPVHRAEPDWLREAVASVRAQTLEDWRLHVVEDGCPAHSAEAVLDVWPAGDPRLRLVRRPQRSGQVIARTTAIAGGDAPWIALLDQDDVYEPEKLADQVARAEAGVDVVSCDVTYVDPGGTELVDTSEQRAAWRADDRLEGLDGDALLLRLFVGNVLDFPSTLFARAAYERAGGYDPTAGGGGDWGFWLDLAGSGARFAHLPRRLYRKRLHEDSDGSVHRDLWHLTSVAAVDRRRDRHDLSGPEVDQRIRDVRRRAARSALRLGRRRDGARLLWAMTIGGQAGEVPGVVADAVPLVGRLRRADR